MFDFQLFKQYRLNLFLPLQIIVLKRSWAKYMAAHD